MRVTAAVAAAGGIAATAANADASVTGSATLVTAAKAKPAPAAAALPTITESTIMKAVQAAPQLSFVAARGLQAPAPRPAQQPNQTQQTQRSQPAQQPQQTERATTRSTSRSTARPAAPARPTSGNTGGNNNTGGTSQAPASASGIIGVASRYLGVPYVFGGSTPAGFDCSGLTQYVYAQLGISIPRTAQAQVASMRHVSNPQPGDLVYFGSPAHHIGIYAGNGKMIAAPYPGQVVRLQQIWDTPSGYLRA